MSDRWCRWVGGRDKNFVIIIGVVIIIIIIIIIIISGQVVGADRQSIIGVDNSLSTFNNTSLTCACRVTVGYCCWIFRMKIT